MSLFSDYIDSVLRSGQIESQGSLLAGRAIAEGQRRKGEIYGQLYSHLGDIISSIPGQMQKQKETQEQDQIRQMQLKQLQTAADGQQRANAIVAGLPRLPDGTFDTAELLQRMAKGGVPIDEQSKLSKSIDDVNGVVRSFQKSQQDHKADMADVILKSHGANDPVTPDSVHLGLAAARATGLATDADEQQIIQALGSGVDPRKALEAIRGQGTRFKDEDKITFAPRESSAYSKAGTVYPLTPSAGQSKTAAEFAGDLSSSDPAVVARARTALEALKNQQKPETDKSLQRAQVLLDGKSAEVLVDPDPAAQQKVFDLEGKPIANAATRVKPIPPASVQTAQSGDGLSQDAIEATATAYRMLGVRAIPTRISGGDRAKILNEASKQSKAIGQSAAAMVTNQLITKADAGALDRVQKMASAADSFESKALGQADIISALSQKVSRTKFPIINNAIQSGRTAITGDEDATKLANAVATFSAEYAKIMEGSTGSAAGSSDSARRAAERLINTGMSKGTMEGVLDLMKQEMRLTLQGYDVAKKHITDRIGGTVPDATPTAPKFRYNPATGQLEPIKD